MTTPVATLEDSKLPTEKGYYTIDETKIVSASSLSPAPPTYTTDNGIGNNPTDATFEAANSTKFYRLNASTNKTGLGITLKVMSGDKLDIFGKSYWNQGNTGGSGMNVSLLVLDILSGSLGGPSGEAYRETV